MADESSPSDLTPEQRKLLEELLRQCIGADLPGSERMIAMIRDVLAGQTIAKPLDDKNSKRDRGPDSFHD